MGKAVEKFDGGRGFGGGLAAIGSLDTPSMCGMGAAVQICEVGSVNRQIN